MTQQYISLYTASGDNGLSSLDPKMMQGYSEMKYGYLPVLHDFAQQMADKYASTAPDLGHVHVISTPLIGGVRSASHYLAEFFVNHFNAAAKTSTQLEYVELYAEMGDQGGKDYGHLSKAARTEAQQSIRYLSRLTEDARHVLIVNDSTVTGAQLNTQTEALRAMNPKLESITSFVILQFAGADAEPQIESKVNNYAFRGDQTQATIDFIIKQSSGNIVVTKRTLMFALHLPANQRQKFLESVSDSYKHQLADELSKLRVSASRDLAERIDTVMKVINDSHG